eukprot:PITA_33028
MVSKLSEVVSERKNLYYLRVEGDPLILVLYVDDLILTRSSRRIEGYKRNLAAKFDMKDLGLIHYFLRLEVLRNNGGIFLGRGRYTTNIMKRFKMQDCRRMSTPMITNWKKIDASEDKDVDPALYIKLIGSLMYLVNMRPDICFIVNTLSQFMVELKRVHLAAARNVLRKRNLVELSYVEAEYMAASTTTCEAIWLRKLLVSLFRQKMEVNNVYCDN